MSEEGLKRRRVRRLPTVLVALAIGVAGVAWAGCGGDDSNSESVDAGEVQTQLEQGVEEATEGVEKGVEEAKQGIEKGAEEAEKGIEKGKEEAQKGIEEGEKQEDRYSP